MTIHFDPAYYFLGLWFIGHDAHAPIAQRQDWLCATYRETPDGPWKLVYRFRRHGGGDAWGPRGEQRWWESGALPDLSDDAMLEKMEQLASQLSGAMGQPAHSVIVQGNGHQAFELLQLQPWVHMRVEEATPPPPP